MSAWPRDLVGERVVLRQRAGVRDGRVVYSDALGELVAVSESFLTVRLENGSTVTVAQDDVHRLRPVPPRRANSALLLGDPERPVPDALAEVRAWYAERGLPALLAVPLPAQAPADHI